MQVLALDTVYPPHHTPLFLHFKHELIHHLVFRSFLEIQNIDDPANNNHECRIRTPKQIVRSLSKKRLAKNTSSVEEELGLAGLDLEDQGRQASSVILRPAGDDESIEASDGDLDDQPQSSVLIIKELDLSQQEQTGMKEKEDDSNHHRQKVAELNSTLEEVKNELEEFKRTSSMERDALRKELDVMKGIDSQPQYEERNAEEKVEWTQKDSEKGGVTGMFASFAGLFDDEGFIKCCLPSGSGRK